jgi:5,10-methylenetetrahydromethanopterin reductase
MKFSIRFNNDRPIADYLRLAQAAEANGFDQFWVSNDLFLRSAPVILTAVAAVTQTIEIGTCILNPYTLNPAEIAMFAATLDELSNARLNLGLAAGAADFLNWVGIEQLRPLAAVTETASAIRQLLDGERVALDGRFLHWKNESYLRFAPRRRVPIYLGAMSPNMLRAIGGWADGGLPLLFPPEHYKNILPYVQEGAQAAGRTLNTIDLAACVWCSISEDRAAAIDVLKEKIAYYGHAMSPLIWEQLGLSRADFAPLERAIMLENDVAKAKSLVTEPMLAIGIVGTSADLIRRLEGLVAMGVQHLSFGPPLGPDPLEAIEAIGRHVIPYFRQARSLADGA